MTSEFLFSILFVISHSKTRDLAPKDLDMDVGQCICSFMQPSCLLAHGGSKNLGRSSTLAARSGSRDHVRLGDAT